MGFSSSIGLLRFKIVSIIVTFDAALLSKRFKTHHPIDSTMASLDTWHADDDKTRAVAIHGHTAAAYIRYAG